MWGIAVYFAVNSSYSNGYAYKCPDGTKKMFYGEVIIGKEKEMPSTPLLKHPPLIEG